MRNMHNLLWDTASMSGHPKDEVYEGEGEGEKERYDHMEMKKGK